MNIVYYPGLPSGSAEKLQNYIENDLRQCDLKQWRKLDLFIREIQLGSTQGLVDQIICEQKTLG